MTGDGGEPLALYVHVPFCVQRCHYCDFAVTRSSDPPVDDWLVCVEQDLIQWQEELGPPGPFRLDTIFVGGGTPSLLGGAGMEKLARLLDRYCVWDVDRIEWSAEANPASFTAETARCWRDTGVNRVSLGVQSFDDRALDWLGRLHDAAGAADAVARARQAGFDNLSVDLIFGLPGDVVRDWRADLRRAVSLGVTHISTYGLTAEPRTPLGKLVAGGEVRMPDDDLYAEQYILTSNELESMHFKQYEVSNFSLDGFECRHNWHYWIGSEYLGLGPSAHSLVRGQRVWNVERWSAYRNAALAGASVREGRETPTAADRRLEALWLGLRTRNGLDLAAYGVDRGMVSRWVSEGWAWISDGILRLTPDGWLKMDALVAELDARLAATDAPAAPGRNQRTKRR